jgi:hypothetical protein
VLKCTFDRPIERVFAFIDCPHQIIVANLFFQVVGLSDVVQNKVKMLGKIFVRDRETEWRRRTANSGGCPTQGNTTQVPEQADISDVTGSSPSGPTTPIEFMALLHWDQGIGVPWCITWRSAWTGNSVE